MLTRWLHVHGVRAHTVEASTWSEVAVVKTCLLVLVALFLLSRILG
jgi:hypothetical protein